MPDPRPAEDGWKAAQRSLVEDYLQREGVDHLGVDEQPAFDVYPYLALWAVQSKASPGNVGWWAISGDLPTDYISSSEGRHPRAALRAISKNWFAASNFMVRGESPPGCTIGTPDQWPKLGDLLRSRAKTLKDYADDDTLWEGL
jgi:hypothetical protein